MPYFYKFREENMEKVFKNNKLGKIFLYIASIFLIVASTVSLVLLLINSIPNLLLIFTAESPAGPGVFSNMVLYAIILPIIFVIILLVTSIVCVVKNKKHGSIKIATILSLISNLFVAMYAFLAVLEIPESITGAGQSGTGNILDRINLSAAIMPMLFLIVVSSIFSIVRKNSKKERKPILNKILSACAPLVAIIFLLSEPSTNINALGGGLLCTIVYALSLISLFLFLIEGVVSIVYLISNRASLHTKINPNLECELVKEEANYKLEKRYLERGSKSVASLVLSIIFVCVISASLIWELVAYIPSVSSALDMAKTSGLFASITALYRSLLLFGLISIIIYFAYGAVCIIIGKKNGYFKLNNFLIFQGLFILFAHFVPVVATTAELFGFAIGNPIILLPLITTVIFVALLITALVFAAKAKKMKNGERSPQLMKQLAISNTLVMSGAILMFIMACIFTLSLQYIPALIGVIILCVLLWLQVKNPREEYILVKTEIQQPEIKAETEQNNENV